MIELLSSIIVKKHLSRQSKDKRRMQYANQRVLWVWSLGSWYTCISTARLFHQSLMCLSCSVNETFLWQNGILHLSFRLSVCLAFLYLRGEALKLFCKAIPHRVFSGSQVAVLIQIDLHCLETVLVSVLSPFLFVGYRHALYMALIITYVCIYYWEVRLFLLGPQWPQEMWYPVSIKPRGWLNHMCSNIQNEALLFPHLCTF